MAADADRQSRASSRAAPVPPPAALGASASSVVNSLPPHSKDDNEEQAALRKQLCRAGANRWRLRRANSRRFARVFESDAHGKQRGVSGNRER